jgi:hypothetical protein
VIYRIATGQLPFQADDTMGMLLAVASDDPKPILTLNAEVPDPLVGLVMRLLAKNPAGRPQSAREVVATLRDIEEITSSRSTVRPAPKRNRSSASKRAGAGWQWALVTVVALIAFGATWFWTDISRIAKNKGLVVINSKESTINVTIKKGDDTVIDATPSRAIELEAGQYSIQSVGDKRLKFSPASFTVERGKKTVISGVAEKR